MARDSFPVDLFNPGQVFACMGFLEVADLLFGHAKGGFNWAVDSPATFEVSAGGAESPVKAVLEFLLEAQRERLAPRGYADPPPEKSPGNKEGRARTANDAAEETTGDGPLQLIETFPTAAADHKVLPLRFTRDGHTLDVTHWCDGSSRNSFKLFAGTQKTWAIAHELLDAARELWTRRKDKLQADPFGVTVPLRGRSFKFDARKAWTTIDAGYSPDDQKHRIEASPVVEMLAAIGLEHARPDKLEQRHVRYGAWKGLLPPALARPALGCARIGVPIRIFRFTLDLAGKNKIVTFAREETDA